MRTKLSLARAVFDRLGAQTLASQPFKDWMASNGRWLKPYAAFCFLRDLFGTAEHWQWGALATYSEAAVARLTGAGTEYAKGIEFTYYLQVRCSTVQYSKGLFSACLGRPALPLCSPFPSPSPSPSAQTLHPPPPGLQYHLHCQLLRASKHAAARRVVLKGDLPIGVDKRSVDAWAHPGLFRMDKSTGAGAAWGCLEGLEGFGRVWRGSTVEAARAPRGCLTRNASLPRPQRRRRRPQARRRTTLTPTARTGASPPTTGRRVPGGLLLGLFLERGGVDCGGR